jgi:hypothetical protein
MKQKSGPGKVPAEQVLKEIRRQTRRQYSAERWHQILKNRILLDNYYPPNDIERQNKTINSPRACSPSSFLSFSATAISALRTVA